MTNASVSFTNANHLGFQSNSFDVALCGFMGWYDSFDFERNQFTQPDTRAAEIWRVLRPGGRFVCCSWDRQEDLSWMEQAVIRHYPAILQDSEYLAQRPIGMAGEKAAGYEVILQSAGFRDITVSVHEHEFVSTDEEEWWRQMLFIDWDLLLEKIERENSAELQRIKEAIFQELQQYKRADGIYFTKAAFFIRAVK